MEGDLDRTRRGHPWWQRRMSTARGSAALAVFYCVMTVAWFVVIAPPFLEGTGGWRVPVAVAFGVGWMLLSAVHVAGAVAHRREDARSTLS